MNSFKIVVIGCLCSFVCVANAQSDSLSVIDLNAAEIGKIEGAANQSSQDRLNPEVSSPIFDPDHEDTEFGELLYNEASVPTRIEVLSLLSKETPPMLVFLQAISMGLGIEDVLDAAANYRSGQGQEYAQSAIALIPLLTDSSPYIYGDYELEDLENEYLERNNLDQSDLTLKKHNPYSVKRVAERFFDDREVLLPYPDWLDGAYHFRASAAELKELSRDNAEIKWYRSQSAVKNNNRPIFVSLYERDGSIVIDGHSRIDSALLKEGEDAELPVVFIYNRNNEVPIDKLEDYPKTLRGIQQAYSENTIMVTPSPEWETGDYVIDASMEEIYQTFDIPEEDDFEPEQWELLLEEAKEYKVYDTSFIAIILASGDHEEVLDAGKREKLKRNEQYAMWRDPRAEEQFPYTPGTEDEPSLKNILSKGIILTRTDLIAALNALEVKSVPVTIYYLDNARTKPFIKGPRQLRAIVNGITPPSGPPSGGGFGPPPECASPPCNN